VGVALARVEFFRFPTNRGWTRDFGPMFIKRDANHPLPPPYQGGKLNYPLPPPPQGGEPASQPDVAIVNFGFNGWAKYSNWQKDNKVASLVARALGCQLFQVKVKGRNFVLEGGSIDGNGRGTLLTTEECLLDPKVQVRNPGFTREETEEAFREYLGVENVLWLGKGIAGDDTHGHVDDLCRFVGPRTVVLCQESDPSDANYRPLQENCERLQGMCLEDGSHIEVAALPMPAPLFLDGQRLPASYANFYISNAAVLVPTFNDPNDRIALGTLAELFPDRPVIGIHAVDLVWGLGTLHCLTHEQPATARAETGN
jgi:agmatine deiminase